MSIATPHADPPPVPSPGRIAVSPRWGLDSLPHLPASQRAVLPTLPSAGQTGSIRARGEDRAAYLPPSTIKEGALNLGLHQGTALIRVAPSRTP